MTYLAAKSIRYGLTAALALAAARGTGGGRRRSRPIMMLERSTLPSLGRAPRRRAQLATGYMTVTNNGTTPDRLSCVSTGTPPRSAKYTP